MKCKGLTKGGTRRGVNRPHNIDRALFHSFIHQVIMECLPSARLCQGCVAWGYESAQ